LDNFNGNIHTVFGTAVHEYAQEMIAGKKNLDLILWRDHFEQHLKNNAEVIGSYSQFFEEWADQGYLILSSFKDFCEKEWADFKFHSYEFLLYEPIPPDICGQLLDDRETIDGESNPNFNMPPFFKGYIDLIMIDPKGNHHLIDLKTATKDWTHWKTDDDAVMAQLKLYKYFYHMKTKIPLSKIKTWYYVMPRTNSARYRQFIEVKSTPKIIEKELQSLDFFFESVYNSKMYPPTLTMQRCKFCDYKGTKNCEQSRIMM
jgi:hypothetical protein